jgi:hypothetical protein
MNFAEYRTKMLPYAVRAKQATNIPHDVILVQWSNESGNGSSAKAIQNNNHAGIKWSKYAVTAGKDSGGFAIYASLDQFVTDYIRVMKLSYYDAVRSAGATNDIVATIKALGASPYDAGHYMLGDVKGGKLLNALGLLSGTTPAPTPTTGGGSNFEKKPTVAHCPSCLAELRLSLS